MAEWLLCVRNTKKNGNGSFTFVGFRATAESEFCWNGIVTPKCGGKEFGRDEFCGKAFDGKTDSIYTYCDVLAVDDIYTELGEAAELFSGSSGSQFPYGDLIETRTMTKPYDETKLAAFYSELKGIEYGADQTCENGVLIRPTKCGSKVYNPDKQFCDGRDERLYKYAAIDGKMWMTENLAFEYKLPKVITEKDIDGNIIGQYLDQIMGTINYEDKAFENYAAAEGRYYTWNSAMGVGDIRKTMSAAELANLQENDRIFGACPAGWRLPTQEELNALSAMANAAEKGFEDLDDAASVTINFNMNFLGYYNVSSSNVEETSEAYFWSSTEVVSDDRQAYGMIVTSIDESVVNTSNKSYAFSIRCLKDTP